MKRHALALALTGTAIVFIACGLTFAEDDDFEAIKIKRMHELLSEGSFFKNAIVTDDLSVKWINKSMVINFLVSFSDEIQYQEAIKKIATYCFKDTPEHLKFEGNDEDIVEVMQNIGKFWYELSYDSKIDELIDLSDTDKIDVGGKLIVIPKIKGFKKDANGRIDIAFIEYVESNPPIRSGDVPSPKCAVIPSEDFGEGDAYMIDVNNLMNRFIERKSKRLSDSDIMVRMNDINYSTMLAYGGDTGPEKNSIVIASFLVVKNRIIMIATMYPWRSPTDYSAGTKLHESWRDAILSANGSE